MKKRILSIVLTLCMVLMLLPITVFAANGDAAELQNLLNGGGTVTLSKDYTIDTTLEVTKTVTLDLNGHVIKMTGSGSVIKVGPGGDLTMTDSNDTATHTDTSLPAGGVITGGNTSVYAGGVFIYSGSFTMNGGTIANCSANVGGGVYVAYGSFIMNGGTIANCSAENSGGGVFIHSDSFTMNGGTIANCNAEHGGGVVAADSFTMTGGTITNCNATTTNHALGGGGVYLSNAYTFTMTGGTIENCSAASTFGGGVFSHGDFSMSGNAIIRGCSAKYAGGVNIESNTTFTMTGGTIEGCIATAYRESDAVKIAIKASLLANGGIVKGMVSFGSLSAINTTITDSCTKFYNKVTSNGTIGGGVYYGGISGSGTVSGTYHTVTFDTNGGSSVPTQWLVNTDKEPALQPADPTRDGYQDFDGWYNGDTKYDFTQPVTQDIILTAKFSNPKTYNISYDLGGGTATNPTSYTVKSDAITLNNPVKTGYTFTGWSGTGLTGENNMTVTIAKGSTGDRAYTAHFSQNSYTVAFDTVGGSSISDKSGVKWTDTVLSGITAPTKDGFEFIGWKCGDVTVNANTKYSDLAANDTVTSVTLVAQWRDIAGPTGEISIGTNKWNSFLNTITFGLFFKDTQTVTVTARDNSGDAVKIEYLLSNKVLSETELTSVTFTSYTDSFSINPDNKYIVYARLTDQTGNVAYLSSNGIVLDASAPVISGVENGKVYCEAQTVTVTEDYIESVKVNGIAVTLDENNRFTLNPAEGTQTIVVTDKAGNVSAEMTVTVNDGHTYEWQSENGKYWKKCKFCGDETAQKDIPTITIDGADAVCVTQDYKFSFTLPEGATDAVYGYEFENKGNSGLSAIIENNELFGIVPVTEYEPSENSFKVYAGAKTADGFKFFVSKTIALKSEHIDAAPKDHICDVCGATLSEHTGGTATCVAKAVCEYCGEEYGELDSTNHNLEKISAKAATVTETGNEEYWHCLDCGKYFADENGKNEIELADTVTQKLPPEIIEGKGQSITVGEKKELTFRSNAAFSDFIRAQLDGKTLDEKYYTVKEGSTIVTLKADCVATLSAGEHTIGIVSESGTATTAFTVNAKAVVENDTKSPQTGDNSHILLWFALLFVSGGAVIGTTIVRKKKKHSEN